MWLVNWISQNWLTWMGLLALIELCNRFTFNSNVLLIVGACLSVVGLIATFAAPKMSG